MDFAARIIKLIHSNKSALKMQGKTAVAYKYS